MGRADRPNPSYPSKGGSALPDPVPSVVPRTPKERIGHGARSIALILSGAFFLAIVTGSVSFLAVVALTAGVFFRVYHVYSRPLAPLANGIAVLVNFLFGAATLTLKTSAFLGGAVLVIYVLYVGFAA